MEVCHEPCCPSEGPCGDFTNCFKSCHTKFAIRRNGCCEKDCGRCNFEDDSNGLGLMSTCHHSHCLYDNASCCKRPNKCDC